MIDSNVLESPAPTHKWLTLVAVCFGLFMAHLDVTIVNVALPSIQSDLHANFSNLEWVINCYTLVFAVALVTMSRLGDIYGRKTMFILGLSIFTLGSLLCAVSGEFTVFGLSHIAQLNISRGIQELGASAMIGQLQKKFQDGFIHKDGCVAHIYPQLKTLGIFHHSKRYKAFSFVLVILYQFYSLIGFDTSIFVFSFLYSVKIKYTP
jgi:MFS family permease